MKKLLLCLQVWEGDIEDGEKLLRLLADISGERRYKFVDLALIVRHDCRQFSTRLVQRMEEVFDKVWLRKCKRKETGYPGGCNGLWHDVIQWSSELHRSKSMDYAALLTTEADACPLAADWDSRLLAAWTNADKPVAGCWLDSGKEFGHINGNAMFDPRIFDLHPKLLGCSAAYPWDIEQAEIFKKLGWADIPEIRSDWQLGTISAERLTELSKTVAWLHGVKDSSARDWAKKNLVKTE
jgi:hypothetical protein